MAKLQKLPLHSFDLKTESYKNGSLTQKRMLCFLSYETKPFYSERIKKLSNKGVEECIAWIVENGELDQNAWAEKVHRMSIYVKPYNSRIEEILSCIGSATK